MNAKLKDETVIEGNTEARDREKAVVELLNRIRVLPEATTPFCETYIRQSPNGFDLMNRPDRGWASSSRWYGTIAECLSAWNVVVTGYGTDKHSFFYRVRPAKPGERPV